MLLQTSLSIKSISCFMGPGHRCHLDTLAAEAVQHSAYLP